MDDQTHEEHYPCMSTDSSRSGAAAMTMHDLPLAGGPRCCIARMTLLTPLLCQIPRKVGDTCCPCYYPQVPVASWPAPGSAAGLRPLLPQLLPALPRSPPDAPHREG